MRTNGRATLIGSGRNCLMMPTTPELGVMAFGVLVKEVKE